LKYRPIIQYENTVSGIFVKRVNRFVAEVLIDGKQESVHVKNTGRLQELLVPDARVTLLRFDNPDRKTAYDLISVYKPGLKWVNIDSFAPNALMKLLLENDGFYDAVRPEYRYGDSRFDFYMESQGSKYLREVKGCTLTSDPRTGIGLFPDAPTERGVKHLKELAEAEKNGFHCTICFVIQMNGVHMVRPNDAAQPEFGQALIRAAKAGVGVIYYSCHVEADSIKITGETADCRYAGM
jgi:sugar fermentation stimulation protein A